MPELITSLAVQHTPFLNAYRAVRRYYDVSITQFAVYWNRALSL